MKVRPGRGDDFVEAWRRIAEEVRKDPANVRQTLARDPADPESFVVTSDWESREAFSAFEKSPEQEELTAPMRELREQGQMTVHEVLIHIEGGEA
jgi:heme-degrading monooxygenase HmoA